MMTDRVPDMSQEAEEDEDATEEPVARASNHP